MAVETPHEKKSVPDGLWIKCDGCQDIIYNKDLEKNHMVCPKCNHYFRLNARKRIEMLLDNDSFREIDGKIEPKDPLGFKDSKSYASRMKQHQKKTGLPDAIITGFGRIGGKEVVFAIAAASFWRPMASR